MTEGGSVWDTGPQYPDMWPAPTEGGSGAPLPPPDDDTPKTGSPVDIDAPPPPGTTAREAQPPPSAKGPTPPRWWQRALMGFPLWMVIAFVAVVLVVFVVIARSGDPGTENADRLQSATSAVTSQPPQATTTASAATVAPPSPTTAAVATTAPVAVPTEAVTTVAVTTSVPPAPSTAAPATAAPTAAPTTPQPAATLPPTGPVVTIIGRVGPCDYGSECLLAGFTLHNFDFQPSEFVCEFADGSRYTFRFNSQGVEQACATGDPTDSITIEVAGVRSATYVHP